MINDVVMPPGKRLWPISRTSFTSSFHRFASVTLTSKFIFHARRLARISCPYFAEMFAESSKRQGSVPRNILGSMGLIRGTGIGRHIFQVYDNEPGNLKRCLPSPCVSMFICVCVCVCVDVTNKKRRFMRSTDTVFAPECLVAVLFQNDRVRDEI